MNYSKKDIETKPLDFVFIDDFNQPDSIDAAFNPAQKRAQKGQGNGGQWISDSSTTKGLTPEEIARHAELEKKFNDGTITPEELEEAQEIVDKAARANGYDSETQLYHGTTHDFPSFRSEDGSPEGDFGLGNYLTTSEDDATQNYAGGGPDLEGRIERETESVYEERMSGINEDDARKQAAEMGVDWDNLEPDDTYDLTELTAKKRALAKIIATERLHGGDDRLIEAYVKLDNPAKIGEDEDGRHMYIEEGSIWDEDAMEDHKPEAIKKVIEDYDLGPDDDLTDYESEIREAQEEWASDNDYYDQEDHPLTSAVYKVSRKFNDVEDSGLSYVDGLAREGASYSDVADALRTRVFQHATNEDGDYVIGEAVRQVFEELGHDSVIDYRVDDKFKNMEGLYDGTYHVISFEGNQIKSSAPFTGTPINERFNDGNDLIKSAYNPSQKRRDDGQWVDQGGVMDELSKDIIDQAREDKEEAPHYIAFRLDEASRGVFTEAQTGVDILISKRRIESDLEKDAEHGWTYGKERQEKANQFHGAFEKTRDLLKKEHGETLTLYRLEAPDEIHIKDKNTLNYFATKQGLGDWTRFHPDRDMISKEVAIDDVLAIQTTKGNYDEVVVLNHESDDLYLPKGGQSDITEAAQASEEPTANPRPSDDLAGAVLEGLTGVSKDWLGGVKPFFDRLAALAESGDVSDGDFVEALDGSQAQLPELFDSLDTEALITAFEEAIGAGVIAGAEHQLKPKE